MSSLWTPGGEHPVDREAPAAPPSGSPTADPTLDDEIAAALPEGVGLDDLSPEERARAEAMIKEMAEARERLVATPASTIIANHAMGLYELAALHLSLQTPDLDQARLAIDALAAVVQGLDGRLEDAEATLKEALTQVQMAYVQLRGQGADHAADADEAED